MRYLLVDRIIDLQPGKEITAVKAVSAAEDYLQDHFPRFPVLPGVMMLEVIQQAAAWLIRQTDDFAHAVIVMREANNVKFTDLVTPGQTLVVRAEIVSDDGTTTKVKATGTVDGRAAVSARLVFERFHSDGSGDARLASDAFQIKRLRDQFELIYHPENSTPSSS